MPCGGTIIEHPCPHLDCRYHLAHEAAEFARIARPAAVATLARWPATCAIDVANNGPHWFDEIATMLGCTRERVRQIYARASAKLNAFGSSDFSPQTLHMPDAANQPDASVRRWIVAHMAVNNIKELANVTREPSVIVRHVIAERIRPSRMRGMPTQRCEPNGMIRRIIARRLPVNKLPPDPIVEPDATARAVIMSRLSHLATSPSSTQSPTD